MAPGVAPFRPAARAVAVRVYWPHPACQCLTRSPGLSGLRHGPGAVGGRTVAAVCQRLAGAEPAAVTVFLIASETPTGGPGPGDSSQ